MELYRGIEEPKFEHDCSNCIFLGHFNGNDLYFCPHDLLYEDGNVVARYDSDGPEYVSGRTFAEKPINTEPGTIPVLRVAYLIAKDLGLIKK